MSHLQLETLEITTNVGCTVECPYCPQSVFLKRYRGLRSMYLNDFFWILRSVPSEVAVHFSGMSEPFLNPLTPQMISHANYLRHSVTVFTTLVGASLEGLEAIKEVPFYDFVVHIPSKEYKENIPTSTEYLEMLNWVDRRVSRAKFLCFGTPLSSIVKNFPAEKIKKIKIKARAGNLKNQNPHNRKISCSRSLKRNVVLPDGTVLLCCQDYDMKHILGNLMRDSLEEIHNGDEMQRIYAGLSDKKADILCRTCELAVPK